MKKRTWEIIKIPCEWCKAVEPNIDAARSCAIAPNATIEQLQDKEWLMDRLPALVMEFKRDIGAIGFVYGEVIK